MAAIKYVESVPSLRLLMFTKNSNGNKYNLIKSVATGWRTIASVIQLPDSDIHNIQAKFDDNVRRAEEVFTKWINNYPLLPKSERYGLSWEGLQNILDDSGFSQVAINFFDALERK